MNDEECHLAAAFHPKFRLFWLEKYDSDKVARVRNRMESLVEDTLNNERNNLNEAANFGITASSSNEEEDFFSAVRQMKNNSNNNSRSMRSKAQNLIKVWLNGTSKSCFTNATFLGEQVLIRLFIKYNTAIPSSAAVEPFFFTGKDILRPKRSSLSDKNFNMLMFAKGNMHVKDY